MTPALAHAVDQSTPWTWHIDVDGDLALELNRSAMPELIGEAPEGPWRGVVSQWAVPNLTTAHAVSWATAGGLDMTAQGDLAGYARSQWGSAIDPDIIAARCRADSPGAELPGAWATVDRLVACHLARIHQVAAARPGHVDARQHSDPVLAHAAAVALASLDGAPWPTVELPSLAEALATIPTDSPLVMVLDGRVPAGADRRQAALSEYMLLQFHHEYGSRIDTDETAGQYARALLTDDAIGWVPLWLSGMVGPLRIDRVIVAGDVSDGDPEDVRLLIEGAFTRGQIVAAFDLLGLDLSDLEADPSFPLTVVDGLIDFGGHQAPAGAPLAAHLVDLPQAGRLLGIRLLQTGRNDDFMEFMPFTALDAELDSTPTGSQVVLRADWQPEHYDPSVAEFLRSDIVMQMDFSHYYEDSGDIDWIDLGGFMGIVQAAWPSKVLRDDPQQISLSMSWERPLGDILAELMLPYPGYRAELLGERTARELVWSGLAEARANQAAEPGD